MFVCALEDGDDFAVGGGQRGAQHRLDGLAGLSSLKQNHFFITFAVFELILIDISSFLLF